MFYVIVYDCYRYGGYNDYYKEAASAIVSVVWTDMVVRDRVVEYTPSFAVIAGAVAVAAVCV
jgi:hypothetical protein